VTDLARIRTLFSSTPEFDTSPLYSALSQRVAADDELLALAAHAPRGQYPTFLFFGAVHYLLLGGATHELAEFYPSIVGAAARDPRGAAAPFAGFCREHAARLTTLVSSRFVQTNIVARSLALRLGLAAVRAHTRGPVQVVEFGASAGLNLRFDRYGYRVGGRRFGDPDAKVQIDAGWHGPGPVPDLDDLPEIAGVAGVDPRPLRAEDPEDRRWLRALVWPENARQADLLERALAVVAADPPTIWRGRAETARAVLADSLPRGEPRVAFHIATRMHVAVAERDAFDAGIAALGQDAPLYVLSAEVPPDPDPRPRPARRGVALALRQPNGVVRDLAVVEGHLRWVESLPG
jgi:hypothetical protein